MLQIYDVQSLTFFNSGAGEFSGYSIEELVFLVHVVVCVCVCGPMAVYVNTSHVCI